MGPGISPSKTTDATRAFSLPTLSAELSRASNCESPRRVSTMAGRAPMTGEFVAQFQVDPNAGSAFGIALRPLGNGFIFATVDDTTAVLDIWVVR
jgi:hypothetical protein